MRVLTLTTPDVENGKRFRVTIWFAGCNHHCDGCHNKHTWDYNQGTNIFDEKVLNKIFEEVDKDYIDGITLSGGDPLSQPEENLKQLYEFLILFKEKFPNKTIWVYSGSILHDLLKIKLIENILSLCNVLVDGKFIKEEYDPDLKFKGSKNQVIWKNDNGNWIVSEYN